MAATQRGYEIMPDELDAIRMQLAKLSTDVASLSGDIKYLRQMLESEGARCLYREKIDAAWQLVPRVGKMEDRLLELKVQVAGIAVVSAIVTALITYLVTGAFKP
jgi:hypothetical protein